MKINKDKDLFGFICEKCGFPMWDSINGSKVCCGCKKKENALDKKKENVLDEEMIKAIKKLNIINATRYSEEK